MNTNMHLSMKSLFGVYGRLLGDLIIFCNYLLWVICLLNVVAAWRMPVNSVLTNRNFDGWFHPTHPPPPIHLHDLHFAVKNWCKSVIIWIMHNDIVAIKIYSVRCYSVHLYKVDSCWAAGPIIIVSIYCCVMKLHSYFTIVEVTC